MNRLVCAGPATAAKATEKSSPGKKLAVGRLIQCVIILILLTVAWVQLGRLQAASPGYSLRYESPLTGQAAFDARRYAVQQGDKGFWPTFWEVANLPLESQLRQANAQCLLYSGEGRMVWPARFASGGWPGATDESGCVVSTALAWRLWGSHDVVGKTLKMDGEAFTVRGVFEEDDALCLAQVGDTGCKVGWQGVELDVPNGTPKSQVETFAQNSGLGTASAVLPGSGIRALGTFLFAMPLVLLALQWLAKYALGQYRRRPATVKFVLVAAALLFALALPALLRLLPPWVVPAQWSDFSHWQALAGQFGSFLSGLMAIAPTGRDVMVKQALLVLFGACCVACPLCCQLVWRPVGGSRPAIQPPIA